LTAYISSTITWLRSYISPSNDVVDIRQSAVDKWHAYTNGTPLMVLFCRQPSVVFVTKVTWLKEHTPLSPSSRFGSMFYVKRNGLSKQLHRHHHGWQFANPARTNALASKQMQKFYRGGGSYI